MCGQTLSGVVQEYIEQIVVTACPFVLKIDEYATRNNKSNSKQQYFLTFQFSISIIENPYFS